ncbi:MAG: DUF3575 domain-containing protein [Cytophagaceae bacterium]|jgi:hypothetical protein|nr:DUF3575 domain-containing protein [Cytophagaceae bacterium]
MKILILSFYLFISSFLSFGQYKNKVSVNIPNVINWAYEHQLGTKFSWQITALGIPRLSTTLTDDDDLIETIYTNGVSIIPEIRYYPFAKSFYPFVNTTMKGFYIAPFTSFAYLIAKKESQYFTYTYSSNGTILNRSDSISIEKQNGILWGGGIVLGGQILIFKRLNVDLYAGGGYAATWVTNNIEKNTFDFYKYYNAYGLPFLRVGFRVGYYFNW